MKNFLFYFLLFIYLFVFWITSKILRQLAKMHLLPRLALKRVQWEKSYLEELILSKQKNWDYLFECASEGELEQIYILLEKSLAKNDKVLLLFTSPSVERNVLALKAKFPTSLSVCCVPILNLSWDFLSIRAKQYIQVKYDFFPHLLYLAFEAKNSMLISAYWPKRGCLKYFFYFPFKSFTTQSYETKQKLVTFFPKREVFLTDYRLLRIFERQERSMDTLATKFPNLSALFEQLSKERHRVVMHGNFWPGEWPSITNVHPFKNALVYILIPHDVSDKSLKIFQQWEQEKKIYLINSDTIWNNSNFELTQRPIVLFLRGVLCELYSLCQWAVVGGGFQAKVHSLLEPYLAGTRVLCGPGISYSQEYDLVESNDPGGIQICKTVEMAHQLIIKQFETNIISKNQNRSWALEFRQQTQLSISHIFRQNDLRF